jgi:protoporphyrin/coproporphyrin ferrochelatase
MTMTRLKTAVMLIGFGGPTKDQTPREFLSSVLRGVQVPEARFNEVLDHYEEVGGVSPYIENTCKQKDALKNWLEEKGLTLDVLTGFRHSPPYFKDVFQLLDKEKINRIIGFVLSVFRSYASFEKYTERIEEGLREANAQIQMVYAAPFHTHPLFIGAQSERIEEVLGSIRSDEATFYLFTAHSIPQEMSDKSGYAKQFEETSLLIAKNLGLKDWGIAYQSRSGNPREPWLGPDANDLVTGLPTNKFKNVLVVPVGFLCENVEILFDLDRELKKTAEAANLQYKRASTVMDHPDFIELMGRLIVERIRA